MRSVIHESDTIENTEHEFGESLEPRMAAVFVANDGSERPMMLTRAQIAVAMGRAKNEPAEAEDILLRHKRHRAIDAALVVASVVISGIVGLAIGAWGL